MRSSIMVLTVILTIYGALLVSKIANKVSSVEQQAAIAVNNTHSNIVNAIWQVESGGSLNPPKGDGGAALGPLQIHKAYWIDATEFNPRIGGTYEDCSKIIYSKRILRAYMKRYVPNAWNAYDAEIIARTHNGGPRGAQKQATIKYWKKVKAYLNNES